MGRIVAALVWLIACVGVAVAQCPSATIVVCANPSYGGLVIGQPTGGFIAGAINAPAIYINGLPVSPGGTPAGPSGAVQFGSGGVFAGSAKATLDSGGDLALGGRLSVTTSPVWSGVYTPQFGQTVAVSGAPTGSTAAINQFTFTDTVDASGLSHAMAGINTNQNYAGIKGGRVGLQYVLDQTAANMDSGVSNFYVGGAIYSIGAYSQPGATTTQPLGNIVGWNPVAILTGTPQNILSVNGEEVDLNTPSGSTYAIRTILALAGGGTGPQGFWTDAMLWMHGNGSENYRYGILFGDVQPYPLGSNSTIIGANEGGTSYGTLPLTSTWGVDFQQVVFPSTGNPYDGGLLRGNGITVDGAGTINTGSCYQSWSTTGEAYDCKGSVGAGATINTPGSGYSPGTDTVVVAEYGGIWLLTVNGSGVPTAVSVLVQPVWPNTSTPPAIATPTPRNPAEAGTGLVLNLTWHTTATTLALNPSGGTVTVGAIAELGKNSTVFAEAFGGGTTATITGAGATNSSLRLQATGTGTVQLDPVYGSGFIQSSGTMFLSPPATWSGGSIGLNSALFESTTWTGTGLASGPTIFNNINGSTHMSLCSAGCNATEFNINLDIGGSSTTGSAHAFVATMGLASPTGNAGVVSGAIYTSGQFYAIAGSGDGGTALASYGSMQALNTVMGIASGQYFTGMAGIEEDNYAALGTSVNLKVGHIIGLSQQDYVQGTTADVGLSVIDTSTAQSVILGWKNVIGFGAYNASVPFSATSTIIGVIQNTAQNFRQNIEAAQNMDFRLVDYGNFASASPGNMVLPNGGENIGALQVAPLTTGASINVGLEQVSSLSVVVGGNGYQAGDVVTGPNGGIYGVTESGGAITALSVVVPDYYAAGSTPTNPVSLMNGSGIVATANLTFTLANTLAIQTGGGDTLFGTQAAMSTTALVGYVGLPFTNGAPTATPTNNALAVECQVNATSKSLNCYIPGLGWYHAAMTAGAG